MTWCESLRRYAHCSRSSYAYDAAQSPAFILYYLPFDFPRQRVSAQIPGEIQAATVTQSSSSVELSCIDCWRRPGSHPSVPIRLSERHMHSNTANMILEHGSHPSLCCGSLNDRIDRARDEPPSPGRVIQPEEHASGDQVLSPSFRCARGECISTGRLILYCIELSR